MGNGINRREFVTGAAAAGVFAAVPGLLRGAPAVHTRRARPVVVASANGHRYRNGGERTCVETVFEMITQGEDVVPIRQSLGAWTAAEEAHGFTRRRRVRLVELLAWRNSIVHQDFARSGLGGRTGAHLEDARRSQRACDGLAETFDRVVGEYLGRVTGAHPWTRMGR
jgi:hypothetical protein